MKLSRGSNLIKKVRVEKRMNCVSMLITGTFVNLDIFESEEGNKPSSDIEATILI